ncbi:MAG: hypothetical protein ACRDHM_06500 [Actinomycetota bacterium]
MRGFTRVALIASSALALATAAAIPGGAQPTTVTTIKYAATSSSSGITFAITAPGSTTPAAGVFGAATTAEVTSDGPSAKGKADALAVLTQSPVTAESKAPPDEAEKTANSPVPAIAIPAVATVGALQGSAKSVSEAEDESPSTSSTGSFGAVSISLAGLPALPVIGTVGGSVNIAGMKTTSAAGAPKATDVSANAASDGVVISADLDISGLSAVCGLIPIPQLQQACNSLATPSQLINITAGPSDVECHWDGHNADCDGGAATATVTLAGQAPQTVAPGQTVTIPDADPFLVRVRAGSFEETVAGDEGSAISAGLSIELIGQTRANPGLITLAIGQSTAGVNGEITVERTTAPTGGGLLPFFVGGSALAVVGYGLRRYLKRA